MSVWIIFTMTFNESPLLYHFIAIILRLNYKNRVTCQSDEFSFWLTLILYIFLLTLFRGQSYNTSEHLQTNPTYLLLHSTCARQCSTMTLADMETKKEKIL